MTNIEDVDLVNFPFSEDILYRFDEREFEIASTSTESVDLSLVKGCCHPDYMEMSWGELKPVSGTSKSGRNKGYIFNHLKRAYSNVIDLSRYPDYYLNTEIKDYWSFYCLDGYYFVSTGMHRTIIGRYFLTLNNLPTIIHGVTVTHLHRAVLENNCRIPERAGFLKKIQRALFN